MKKIEIDMLAAKRFIKNHKKTQAQMSAEMGISEAYLSRVLNKKRNPAVGFIKGLIKIGMPAEKIFKK